MNLNFPHKLALENLTYGGFVMAKYSFEFKPNLVNEYLQGKTSYEQLAQNIVFPGMLALKNGWPNILRMAQKAFNAHASIKHILFNLS